MILSDPDVTLTIWKHFVEECVVGRSPEEGDAALKNASLVVGATAAAHLKHNPMFVFSGAPPQDPQPVVTKIGSILGFAVYYVEGLP